MTTCEAGPAHRAMDGLPQCAVTVTYGALGHIIYRYTDAQRVGIRFRNVLRYRVVPVFSHLRRRASEAETCLLARVALRPVVVIPATASVKSAAYKAHRKAVNVSTAARRGRTGL